MSYSTFLPVFCGFFSRNGGSDRYNLEPASIEMSNGISTLNLDLLIRAAAFLDRHDPDIDHRYALPLPAAMGRKKSTKPVSLRNIHNELEKNRRAQLHNCLEKLKAVVPLDSSATRHTTLALLVRAQYLIKSLQTSESRLMGDRDQLIREQGRLRRQLDQLQRLRSGWRSTSAHSLSESSTVSSSSSGDLAVFEEQDDIDVIGDSSFDCDVVDDVIAGGDVMSP